MTSAAAVIRENRETQRLCRSCAHLRPNMSRANFHDFAVDVSFGGQAVQKRATALLSRPALSQPRATQCSLFCRLIFVKLTAGR